MSVVLTEELARSLFEDKIRGKIQSCQPFVANVTGIGALDSKIAAQFPQLVAGKNFFVGTVFTYGCLTTLKNWALISSVTTTVLKYGATCSSEMKYVNSGATDATAPTRESFLIADQISTSTTEAVYNFTVVFQGYFITIG